MVYCYDASLEGFRVSSIGCDVEMVGKIGRVKERSRWKLGTESARAGSLQAAGSMLDSSGRLIKDGSGGYFKTSNDISIALEAERWEVDPSFPEVPADLMRRNE